jgi:hypothetical protein
MKLKNPSFAFPQKNRIKEQVKLQKIWMKYMALNPNHAYNLPTLSRTMRFTKKARIVDREMN